MSRRTILLRRTLLKAALGTFGPFGLGSAVARSGDAAAPAPDLGLSLAAGQSLGLPSVPNLRDVGGYAAVGGAVVRKGLAYRSNQLNPVSPQDMAKLARLGLKRDFDLRTADEVKADPDELPVGVRWVWLDVLADAPQSGPAALEKLMRDPKEANAALGGGKVDAMFEHGYREFISLSSARRAYRTMFVALADVDLLPALFHCTTGKDRTGWGAAALLTLLGVPPDQVMADYLRSNDYILPAYKKAIDAFVAGGGEREIPLAILGVKPAYLEAAFDEMHKRYGSIEHYYAQALGMDAPVQKALRRLYLA